MTKRLLYALPLIGALLLAFAPGLSEAAPQDADRIWRAQIRLVTGDVGDAGSDDNVRVSLSAANTTWLDYGRDDFERDSDFTYDLNLTSLRDFRDLTTLEIAKTGSDGWCLAQAALIVNGQTLFSRNLQTPGGQRACLWLDNDGGESRTVTFSDLRSDPTFAGYTQPFPPLVIPRAEMESRLEGMIGHFANGNRLQWGHIYGRPVEVERKDDQTLHVDLDLEAAVENWFNPEVDIDFDVHLSCTSGTFSAQAMNVAIDVDSDWYSEVLSLGIAEYADSEINRAIGDSMGAIAASLPSISVETGICPSISVLSSGDIVFGLPSRVAPRGPLTAAPLRPVTATPLQPAPVVSPLPAVSPAPPAGS